MGLWIGAPEPTLGELTFVTDRAGSIPVAAVAPDGDEIADAANGVRPLWGPTGP